MQLDENLALSELNDEWTLQGQFLFFHLVLATNETDQSDISYAVFDRSGPSLSGWLRGARTFLNKHLRKAAVKISLESGDRITISSFEEAFHYLGIEENRKAEFGPAPILAQAFLELLEQSNLKTGTALRKNEGHMPSTGGAEGYARTKLNLKAPFSRPDFIPEESSRDSLQPRLLKTPSNGSPYHYSKRQLGKTLGRGGAKEALNLFCSGENGFKWAQIAGAAGQGKSRLALELVDELSDEWDAGFLFPRGLKEFQGPVATLETKEAHLNYRRLRRLSHKASWSGTCRSC